MSGDQRSSAEAGRGFIDGSNLSHVSKGSQGVWKGLLRLTDQHLVRMARISGLSTYLQHTQLGLGHWENSNCLKGRSRIYDLEKAEANVSSWTC